MSIKTYFFIAFGSILIAASIMGFSTIETANLLQQENDRVTYAQDQLLHLKRIKTTTNRMLKEVADFTLFERQEELEEYKEAKKTLGVTIAHLRDITRQEIAFIHAKGDPEEEQKEIEETAIIHSIMEQLSLLTEEADAVLTDLQQGKKQQALYRFEKRIEDRYDKNLIHILDAQIADEQEEIDESHTSISELVRKFQQLGISSVAILLSAILFATVIAMRTIYVPIYKLVQAVKEIGEGEHTPRLPKVGGEVGVLSDSLKEMTTQISQTQAQLVQSAKLASIGQLAAGVAHEMNQPLMVIGMNAKMLRKQLGIDEADQSAPASCIDMIVRNTDRLNHIIQHLRKFSRETDAERSVLSVDSLVNDSFTLLAQQLKAHGIKIQKEYQDNLPKILGNKNELEQVFVNLLTNARDAIDRKNGIINVSTSLDFVRNMVRIRVRDNGSGIIPEHLDKVFDPFFTTKDVDKGTGLGLSICYGIIKDHNGAFYISETSEKGTTFDILLPAYEAGDA